MPMWKRGRVSGLLRKKIVLVAGAMLAVIPALALAEVSEDALAAKDVDPLKCEYRSISLSLESADATRGLMVRLAESTPAGEIVLKKKILVREDLAAQVAGGHLSNETAAVLMSDLEKLEGVTYTVPALVSLKTDLGFPPEIQLSDADLEDLVRAHLQIVLSAGPVVAVYLVDHLGIENKVEKSEPLLMTSGPIPDSSTN